MPRSLATRLLTPLLAWAALAVLSGCGQKGPLMLAPPPGASASASAASAPAR